MIDCMLCLNLKNEQRKIVFFKNLTYKKEKTDKIKNKIYTKYILAYILNFKDKNKGIIYKKNRLLSTEKMPDDLFLCNRYQKNIGTKSIKFTNEINVIQ